MMQVSFTENYAIDPKTMWIRFEAIVDGLSINCMVSEEAVYDIDPSNARPNVLDQYALNRFSFERIAEQKIRAGQSAPITITTADLESI